MRRSHEGLVQSYIKKDNYIGIPEELKEFNYFYADNDNGHVIMAIPECLLKEASEDGDLDMYECPIPVKYVLEKGYQIYDNHIICDAEYDSDFGLMVDEVYYEIK